MSLHQIDVAMKYCPRTIALRDGRVVFDGASERLTPAVLRELYGASADELLTQHSAPSARHASFARHSLRARKHLSFQPNINPWIAS